VVERQLAAAAQILPMRSCYAWKGSVVEAHEYLVLIKTRASAYATVEECVRELHSYEVPAVLAVPIVAGSALYLSWIDQNVRP
jgi:periplasmic divalent cation tolerance protein